MVYLFKEHHILPGQYWAMPEGEKTVLWAMYIWDMERRLEK